MAPEQHDGDRVGPAADQFAFAVALLEAVHGEHPFGASSYAELVAAVRAARIRPAPPALDGDGPPPALREALVRALRTAPDERWPSMRALVDALERVLGASGRATAPSDPRERAEASALRRRLEEISARAAAGRYGDAVPLARALRDEGIALVHAPLVAEVLYALGSIEVSVSDWRAAERTLSDAAVAAARARDDGWRRASGAISWSWSATARADRTRRSFSVRPPRRPWCAAATTPRCRGASWSTSRVPVRPRRVHRGARLARAGRGALPRGVRPRRRRGRPGREQPGLPVDPAGRVPAGPGAPRPRARDLGARRPPITRTSRSA